MRKWIAAMIVLLGAMGFFYGSGQTVHAQTTIEKAKVAVSVLNVREGPSLTKPVIAQVTAGDTFNVSEERYGWLKIELSGGRTGWVASQFTVQSAGNSTSGQTKKTASYHAKKSTTNETKKSTSLKSTPSVTLMYNGTNLRSGPGVNYNVIAQGSQGDRFTVLGVSDKWYHIQLPNGKDAFVAGWIVVPSKKENAALTGKTIVLDPGHGGSDTGAIGYGHKVLEKNLTLETVKELAQKLRKAGARVILTRDGDTFVSLQGRVDIAKKYNADAFISIHYNASLIPSAQGVTSYYYTKRKDRPLALAIEQMLVQQTDRQSRGVRFANYHVLRTNPQPATLLELGFITNPWEEHVVQTSSYQDNVTTAIVNGVENYFQAQ